MLERNKNNINNEQIREISLEEAAKIFVDGSNDDIISEYKGLRIWKRRPHQRYISSVDNAGNIISEYRFLVGYLSKKQLYIENIHREVLGTLQGTGIGTKNMKKIEEIFNEIKKQKKVSIKVEFSTAEGTQEDTIGWLTKKFKYTYDEVKKVLNKNY